MVSYGQVILAKNSSVLEVPIVPKNVY